MENLSFASPLDLEPATMFDDRVDASAEGEARWAASNLPPAYRAVSVLDGLSVYAAVFNCSAGCRTPIA